MNCKQLILLLFILKNTICNAQIVDSISVGVDSLLDFKIELNKIKDTLSENQKIPSIFKNYSLLNDEIIIKNRNNLITLNKLSESNREIKLIDNSDLTTRGSISRGVSIGNNQNSVLNSELDLQIFGKLNDKISIKASIQDSEIPFQNNGYSQKIDEFDEIFIELKSSNWNIRGGDIELIKSNSFYGNFEKKIQGLDINTKINDELNIQLSTAISRGNYKESIIRVQNGNQGPYKLIGLKGELYVLIVSGSESVFVNGIKIQRGNDKDYIIDYNSGEIIFNASFPILSDMRVKVEYQVSEKNFNSFVAFTNLKFEKKLSSHNISFFNQNDIKNQPIMQNFSENQIDILSNAGDNESLMLSQSDFPADFNENRILYKKQVINNIQVFVYSNDPNDELFDVRFTNVGDNEGNYILLSNNTIENIYEYVNPINGIKQGNYEPVIFLIPPKKLQLITYNSEFKISNNSNLNFEIAASMKDENLFSNINDNNNYGLASKINFISINKINSKYNLTSDFNFDYINKKFETIERIYNIEFNRDWNLEQTTINNYDQTYSNMSLGFERNGVGSLIYKFDNLRFEDYYNGFKNSLLLNINSLENLRLSSSNSILSSEKNNYDSEFIQSFNDFEIRHKLGWTVLNYNYEKKKSENISQNGNPDFGHQIFEITNGIGNVKKRFIEIGYKKKINDSLVNQNLKTVNYSESYFINSQILNNVKSKLNIFINKTHLYSDNSENESFLNTKLIYNLKTPSGIINSNVFFETKSGNLPQQEYTFIEVEPGLGSYKWIDINDNGIQELEEFEIAIFEDEAKYVRILLPNQTYIKTFYSKLNYSLIISLNKWSKSNKKFEKLLSIFSNKFQLSTDKKSETDVNILERINPFNDYDNLLSYDNNIKNIIYINRGKQRFNSNFQYSKNKSKSNYSYGNSKSTLEHKKLTVIHKIDKLYLFNFEFLNEVKTSRNDNFIERNYTLKKKSIKPKLTYITAENNKLNFIYENSIVSNQVGQEETLNQDRFSISIFLNNRELNNFICDFNYYKNNFTGNQNSIVSYIMMSGLQKGENYTWNLNFQRKISKLLDINFTYNGRKSKNIKTIHNGSIQLKAIF